MTDLADRIERLSKAATPGPVELRRLDNDDASITYQLQQADWVGGDDGGTVVASTNDAEAPKAAVDFELLALLRNNAEELLDALKLRDRLREGVLAHQKACEGSCALVTVLDIDVRQIMGDEPVDSHLVVKGARGGRPQRMMSWDTPIGGDDD